MGYFFFALGPGVSRDFVVLSVNILLPIIGVAKRFKDS